MCGATPSAAYGASFSRPAQPSERPAHSESVHVDATLSDLVGQLFQGQVASTLRKAEQEGLVLATQLPVSPSRSCLAIAPAGSTAASAETQRDARRVSAAVRPPGLPDVGTSTLAARSDRSRRSRCSPRASSAAEWTQWRRAVTQSVPPRVRPGKSTNARSPRVASRASSARRKAGTESVCRCLRSRTRRLRPSGPTCCPSSATTVAGRIRPAVRRSHASRSSHERCCRMVVWSRQRRRGVQGSGRSSCEVRSTPRRGAMESRRAKRCARGLPGGRGRDAVRADEVLLDLLRDGFVHGEDAGVAGVAGPCTAPSREVLRPIARTRRGATQPFTRSSADRLAVRSAAPARLPPRRPPEPASRSTS